jgi:hypothetical protein
VSKLQPSVGDTGVKGTVRVTRNKMQEDFAVGGWGFFDAAVTANGYTTVAQNLFTPRLQFCCDDIPLGIETGDWVTADIVESEYQSGVLIATNITKI